jgi:DoxX-like protein
MNILLWFLQVVLALLYLAGGGFKTFNPDDPAKQIKALPPAAWRALGVFEVVGAALLIVPGRREVDAGCWRAPRSAEKRAARLRGRGGLP